MSDWIRLNLTKQAGYGSIYWKGLFVVLCWLLWRARNESYHSNISTPCDKILMRAKGIMGCMSATSKKLLDVNLGTQARRPHNTSSTSSRDIVLVEVDGAFSYRTNAAACGGIIKRGNQHLIEGFLLKLDVQDNLAVELWGCLMGLKRAWDHGYRDIILRSDSVEVVELIEGEINDMHEDWMLVWEIKEMLQRTWRVEIQQIDRNENGSADNLAKRALSINHDFQILGPNALRAALQADFLIDSS
ncbi:uncharacterized protein LOC114758279 [Neltuma alba]|uniref:uncharacterized protein LOC114758279 n=1 Tax=Neltuma alba TaxID=207710 RepID=UPI0010A31004|nr:uncharacterized protein LOC114758279 [Prosopis alba]